MDGEGELNRHTKSPAFEIRVSQKDNPMLSEIRRVLEHWKFDCDVAEYRHPTEVIVLRITGRWFERLRLLGMVRPKRLLARFVKSVVLDDIAFEMTAKEVLTVESVAFLGDKEVVTMGTSTQTYFAEGFASHNTRLGTPEEIGARIRSNDLMHHSEEELDPLHPYDFELRDVDGHLRGRDARLPRKDPAKVLVRYDETHPKVMRGWFRDLGLG